MTQDEIVMCADASGISLYGMGKDREKFIHYLKAFAKLVALDEREACAQLCEASPEPDGLDLADRIRARGQA
jgi:hypothetical protein